MARRGRHRRDGVVRGGRARARTDPSSTRSGSSSTAAPSEVLHAHVRAARHRRPSLGARTRHAGSRPCPRAISTDPETERFLLFSAVADLLAALSEQAPLVLFLDDLHWADAGTASLLAQPGDGLPTRPGSLIVGTFRIDELSGEHPMGQALAAFHRVPTVSRLHLDGLGSRRHPGARRANGRARTGAGWPRSSPTTSSQETGGNAFFVTEVIRYLEESGSARRALG